MNWGTRAAFYKMKMPHATLETLTDEKFAALKVIGIGPIPRADPNASTGTMIRFDCLKDVVGTLVCY